jgi:hypothetical protein
MTADSMMLIASMTSSTPAGTAIINSNMTAMSSIGTEASFIDTLNLIPPRPPVRRQSLALTQIHSFAFIIPIFAAQQSIFFASGAEARGRARIAFPVMAASVNIHPDAQPAKLRSDGLFDFCGTFLGAKAA